MPEANEPGAPPARRKLPYVHVVLTEDENKLLNWARFRHRPARMRDWARAALLRQARADVARANAAGERVPPEINVLASASR